MENAIKIQLPLTVTYPALEDVLKKQMIGEYIPKQEEGSTDTPYAQILDVGVAKSSTGKNEIILNLKIRVLKTMLKRDEVNLFVQASLNFDNTSEELYVERFRLESRTSSMLYNTGLEVLANKVAYSQIIQKASVNLKSLIQKELAKANNTLAEGLELKGLKLLGKIENLNVLSIDLQPKRLQVILALEGNLTADIFDLISLMPNKA